MPVKEDVFERDIADLAIYADKCLRRRTAAYKARNKVFSTFAPSIADTAAAVKAFDDASAELAKARAKLRYAIRKFHPDAA